ncbi:hypothetical protein KO561_01025 [Radiobacillus kanasensis]|uniref:CBO0543 family protein n=1 Tax=Radiobacillus kanasensis TaxID=2844358 RepID=UPI001E40BE90|nr:CBO0543 family protein [Radiobacillus kanasensis]UFT99590.1 hypothetical protein KO561_01025 [Radiobacillus kanasensis]
MEPHLIFMVVASIVLSLIAYLIPKKLKWYEIYTTSSFAVLFGLLVDTILAVKYKIYVLDKAGIQIGPLIGQVIMYSTTSAIILNTFPYNRPVKYKIIYILCFSFLTVILETIALKCGFIKYNEWKMWYSALCYPFLIYFLVLHLKFFQRIVKKSF